MFSSIFIHPGPDTRLDAAIAQRFPQLPRALVRRGIVSGAATVNGRVVAKGGRCHEGDVIALTDFPELPDLTPQPNPGIAPGVIYEDDALLAFNKPAGLHCHPNAPEERDTLANGALACWPELAGIGDSPLMCGILHRIDAGTSGLVLATKTQDAYDNLRLQFAARTVRKTYLAVVRGKVGAPATLRHTLAHHPDKPGHIVDAKQWWNARHPMLAETSYRPLRALCERDGFALPATLLEVVIFTGVTHQIRCQLSLAGFPIFGDDRYGGASEASRGKTTHGGAPSHHWLHAFSAALAHPVTQRGITLTAPPPPGFPQPQIKSFA